MPPTKGACASDRPVQLFLQTGSVCMPSAAAMSPISTCCGTDAAAGQHAVVTQSVPAFAHRGKTSCTSLQLQRN